MIKTKCLEHSHIISRKSIKNFDFRKNILSEFSNNQTFWVLGKYDFRVVTILPPEPNKNSQRVSLGSRLNSRSAKGVLFRHAVGQPDDDEFCGGEKVALFQESVSFRVRSLALIPM